MKQRKYFSEIKTGYKVGSPKEKPFGKPEIRGLNRTEKFTNSFLAQTNQSETWISTSVCKLF